MKLRLLAPVMAIWLLSVAAGAAPAPDVASFLPPGARITATAEADVTGDGRPELIVGYALPRETPPTEGVAAVLERTPAGGFRLFPLRGRWPGHYPLRFRALDLTGDGRPELVEEAGGGAAWGFLRVFRRGADGYELLLEDAAQAHVLWDADGDGRPEVIARYRTGTQADQALQRFIWRDGRFVTWHAPEWTYADWPERGERVPDLRGRGLKAGEKALADAGFNLGVIAQLDVSGKPGRIVRYNRDGGQVHVVMPAGNTRFWAATLPSVESVHYVFNFPEGAAPVAGTTEQRAAWRQWLDGLNAGVRQVVHTRFLRSPAYVVRLQEPWKVKLGDSTELVRWVGVGLEPPHLGLLYLATGEPRPGYTWPPFRAALYTTRPVKPEPIPEELPLGGYLKRHPEPEAFVTRSSEGWETAVRLRGISSEGWPALRYGPALEGSVTPDPRFVPLQDHVLVTVLNGFVRQAERNGDEVHVGLVAAPGRVYRWPLPLTGFDMSTRVVRVHLQLPGRAPQVVAVALDGWVDWTGNPGPGSLPR